MCFLWESKFNIYFYCGVLPDCSKKKQHKMLEEHTFEEQWISLSWMPMDILVLDAKQRNINPQIVNVVSGRNFDSRSNLIIVDQI